LYEKNKRLPTRDELGRGPWGVINRRFNRKSIFKDAISEDGIYRKVDGVVNYSKKDLIKFRDSLVKEADEKVKEVSTMYSMFFSGEENNNG
jgi:hypothetical protein